MITLEELLESRDARAAHQRELLAKYPGCALLCLTVQLPGAEKRNALSLKIARAGVEAVRRLGPLTEELKDLETGYEGYFIFDEDPMELKKKAVGIEDTHILGRLFDLDVIDGRSESAMTGDVMPDLIGHLLDRSAIGLPPRKCLLCDNSARYCMRAKTHTTEELLKKIESLCAAY